MSLFIAIMIRFMSSVLLGILLLLTYRELSNNENLSLRKNVFLSVIVIISFSLCFANAFLYLIILLIIIFI